MHSLPPLGSTHGAVSFNRTFTERGVSFRYTESSVWETTRHILSFMSNSQISKTRETEFPVRYAETDAMGVVHHANYLVYFEEGRSQYMRDLGSDYALIEASGYRLPVTEAQLRYVGSSRYGERVRIRTCIGENRSRRLTFHYEVIAPESQDILVTGYTRHIWTDVDGKVTRVPEIWRELVGCKQASPL